MKKTLMIHPKDDSTDFLKGIYTENLVGTDEEEPKFYKID